MKRIQNISNLAYDHLMKFDPKAWSKTFISTLPKADNIENICRNVSIAG